MGDRTMGIIEESFSHDAKSVFRASQSTFFW